MNELPETYRLQSIPEITLQTEGETVGDLDFLQQHLQDKAARVTHDLQVINALRIEAVRGERL